MRRSPNEYDVRVTVQTLESPAPLPNLLELLLPGRTWADLAVYLRRRATVHMAVLGMAAAVLAASAFSSNASGNGPAFSSSQTSDSLVLSAANAIMARAIPFTVQANSDSYVVQAGDTISSISRRVGVDEETLLAYNGLASSDALSIGVSLRIPDLSKVAPEQFQLHDTVPHDSVPLVGDATAAPATPAGPQKPAPDISVHEVVSGDNPSTLAASAGISVTSLLQVNNLKSGSILSVGQQLIVPGLSGTLIKTTAGDTIPDLANKFGIPAEALAGANKLNPQNPAIAAGQPLLIPADPQTAIALAGAGSKAETTSATTAPAAKPATRPVASGGFSWPATGTITTYFSSWHNGIDIANSSGTPVHAAQAGVVTYSGWDNSGFGYMIRIDHGNGLQTLYGHSSKLIARAGDSVAKGDVIMLMGSTGNSTGPHVHFSIFRGSGYNGINPLTLLP